MSLWLAILLIILALIGGGIGGFFLARKYMMNYFQENPPIDADMLRMMMLSMDRSRLRRKFNKFSIR